MAGSLVECGSRKLAQPQGGLKSDAANRPPLALQPVLEALRSAGQLPFAISGFGAEPEWALPTASWGVGSFVGLWPIGPKCCNAAPLPVTGEHLVIGVWGQIDWNGQDHNQGFFPEISIDMYLSDTAVDAIREGYGAAIRIAVQPGASLAVQRLCEMPRYLVGAPNYLAEHGRPKHPLHLTHHG